MTPATAIAIDDPDDPRIAGYRAVRERDLAGRDGVFIAEGDVVVRVLIASGRWRVRSVLVSERRWPAAAEVLAGLDEAAKIYAVNQSVMDAIVGFPIHRGLLALGERRDGDEAGDVLDQAIARAEAAATAGARPIVTVVGAIGIANHDNLGGIFRNAAAFGAAAVLIDDGSCDPLYRKAIRVSVGGALVVPFARGGDARTMIALLEARGFEVIALAPRAAHAIDELSVGPRRAILLGAEGPGLPAEVLARVRGARIDIVDSFDSLNVAVTAGIALHALRRK